VDSLDVKAWAASITRNGSSATVVNRAVGILAGILDDAVEHRALAFNPARRFKRGEKPKKSPKRHVYLTEEDHAARFAAHLRESGCQFRRECPRGVTDARPQRSEHHVEELCGSFRQ
jgi:hypothetical protein